MRSLRAVGSTIYSMIKFPTNQGVVIMETSREALRECKHLERVQGSWKEVQWRQREEQMSKIREQVILRTKSNSRRGPDSGPASPEKTCGREDAEEVFTIGYEHPDQHVTMGTTLTTNYKQLLANILRENMEVDYSSLNKACAKDIYPFPEEEEELTSLMGYPYKCFLQLSKEYSQIRITEDDEEKTGFYTEEGEVEGSVVKKFFGKEEQVERTPDANKGGTLTLSKKIQAKSTPAPRVWRLYLGKETIEEGSGVGIILVGPEETMLSYVIRLKFNASNHVMDCKALLAGLAASANQGMKDLHVFIDSLTLVAQVPNHTPPKNPEPKSKSVNRVCNYKDRIPQPGSIGVILGVMYHDLSFGGKTLIEIENVGLTFAQVSSKAHRKGVGLRMTDSYTGNHPKVVLCYLKLFEGLKTTWEHSPKKSVIYHRGQEMDFRSFMLGGVDGELTFLPVEIASKGQNSPSVKSVNNAPIIGVTPLSSVYPSNVVENVDDSDDPSYGEDEQNLIGPSLSPHPQASKKFEILGKRKVASDAPGGVPLKVQKVPARASKVVGEASTPLDVDSDSDIHEFPSAKELKISIEQLCDIHDRAYMRQAVLDNVLNSKTRELISTLHKAKTSYDAIRARELEKDKAYAKLERKCNEALQDLDKNPIILSSIRAKIEGIKSERERLKSSKIKLLQEIDSLKQDRAIVVSKVVSDAAMKLIRSDDLEVAAMEEPFVLENMSGYRPSSKEEYEQAGDALANSSYPFLAEYVANPYASLEQLLSKKPPLLRPTFSGSCSKPLSPKVK
ncbi:MAK10-like protein [Tanacetum coccineum]